MKRPRPPMCPHCGQNAAEPRSCCHEPWRNVRDPAGRERARLLYPGRPPTPPDNPTEGSP